MLQNLSLFHPEASFLNEWGNRYDKTRAFDYARLFIQRIFVLMCDKVKVVICNVDRNQNYF